MYAKGAGSITTNEKGMKKKLLYKFLRSGLKSDSGDMEWLLNTWYHEDNISICNKGFHASKTPLQALKYVAGEILSQVEVKGKSEVNDDKECWSDMRIVKAYHWKKEDSVALSIFASECVLENFEKVFPDDKRPREAIEAARKWLAEPTEANQSAARLAAESAWLAAAWSAESARSARLAAESAESARLAAESAESAWSAARSAKEKLIASLDAWFLDRITQLEECK